MTADAVLLCTRVIIPVILISKLGHVPRKFQMRPSVPASGSLHRGRASAAPSRQAHWQCELFIDPTFDAIGIFKGAQCRRLPNNELTQTRPELNKLINSDGIMASEKFLPDQ